jgi:hypothetical protein
MSLRPPTGAYTLFSQDKGKQDLEINKEDFYGGDRKKNCALAKRG